MFNSWESRNLENSLKKIISILPKNYKLVVDSSKQLQYDSSGISNTKKF